MAIAIANDCRRILRGVELQADLLATQRFNEFGVPGTIRRRLSDYWEANDSRYRLGHMIIKSPGIVTVSFCLNKSGLTPEEQTTEKQFRYSPHKGELVITFGAADDSTLASLEGSFEEIRERHKLIEETGVMVPSIEEKLEFQTVIHERAEEVGND